MRRIDRASQNAGSDGDIDSDGSWAISYGDMVTLLLCFFILFFTVDPQRDYQENLQLALLSLLEKSDVAAKGVGGNNKSGGGTSSAGSSETLSYGTESTDGIDKDLLDKWQGVPHKVGKRILIEFPAVSFFRSGEVDLTREGIASLKKFVDLYIPYAGQNKLIVRAFTDHRTVKPSARTYRDNLELSALRSVSAMRLLSQSGVPLSRMRVGGYGEFRLSPDQLETLPPERRPAATLDLARKIVLLIEPEEADL